MSKRTKTELLAGIRGTPCIANRKNGEPCKRWALKGASVCWSHGAAAPQVREAAARRLENAIDRLLAALLHIAEDEAQPAAARVSAIRDALDRAGFGRDRTVTVKVAPWMQDIEVLLVDVVPRGDIVDAELVDDVPEEPPFLPANPRHLRRGPQ